jgi:hypothetical protein
MEKSGFTAAGLFAGFCVFAAISHLPFGAFFALAVFAAGCNFTVFAALAAFHAFAVLAAVRSCFAAILAHGAFAVFAAIFAIAAFFSGSGSLGRSVFPVVLAALVEFFVHGIRCGEILGVIPGIGNGLLDLFVVGTLVAYCQDFGFGAPVGFCCPGLFGGCFDGFLTHTAVAPDFDVFRFGLLGEGGNRQEEYGENAEDERLCFHDNNDLI